MFSTSVSSEKMKNKKVAAAGVSLSEAYALSEQHPLSETSARLASQENLEENLPHMHALAHHQLAQRVICLFWRLTRLTRSAKNH